MPGLNVGVARAEITAWEPGVGMMGWGMAGNVVRSVATPLHARAFVLHNPDHKTKLALVVCEIAIITLALREEVCRRLRTCHADLDLDLDRVMLMATHTHSGPGGYTHYPFYNVTIPGFSQTVLEGLAGGIVQAIVAAFRARVPALVRFAEGTFAADADVAFNRALEAYNRNPDVTPVTSGDPREAIDPTMRLIRFDSVDGRPLGSLNWFSVHCTSVHSDNTAIHFDNKGYAAQLVERTMAERGVAGYVAAFAQGAAGDVTPNHWRHRGRPFVRGKFRDDDESARHNGGLQAQKALELLDATTRSAALPIRLGVAHTFVDLSDVEVDPAFVDGRTGCRTGPAEIGMAMFFGTEEGPGLPRRLRFLQDWAATIRPWWRSVRGRLRSDDDERARARIQGEKITWVESGRRRVLGIRRLSRLPLPWRLHPALQQVRRLDSAAAYPWTPNILPLQLMVVGDVCLVAVPGELTTVAGRRLAATVARAMQPHGVERAVLAGYANAYAGYVTTPEEYACQGYEGASTHFGTWTLPAYQMLFDRLARDLGAHPRDRSVWPELQPPSFDPDELATRTFTARRPAAT